MCAPVYSLISSVRVTIPVAPHALDVIRSLKVIDSGEEKYYFIPFLNLHFPQSILCWAPSKLLIGYFEYSFFVTCLLICS